MNIRNVILGCSIVVCITAVAFAFVLNQQYSKGQTVYVKATVENLRDAPQGNKLGAIDKSTSLTVLEDSGQWTKVRLEGWIWKESLTDSKLALQGNVYRAQQIVVKELSTAEKALKRVKSGEDFGAVAKELSIGPAAKKGGDLGYFSKGDFQPEIEKVILSLQPGQISGIVKSAAGYHIFKRTE